MINEKIYFSGDTSDIISDILKKYQLEETDEELSEDSFEEKMGSSKPFIFRGEIILKAAMSLAKKEITEKDAISLISKNLNVPQTTAEGLVNEVKIRLIPIATTKKPVMKNNENESMIKTDDEKNKNIFPNIKLQIENPNKNLGIENVLQPKKLKNKKLTVVEETEKSMPQTNQTKGSDSYREPIE